MHHFLSLFLSFSSYLTPFPPCSVRAQLPAGVSPVDEHSIARVPLAADIRALDLARVDNRNAVLWNAQREQALYFDAEDASSDDGGSASAGAGAGAGARSEAEAVAHAQAEAETAGQQRWQQWQQNWQQGASAENGAGAASSELESGQSSRQATAEATGPLEPSTQRHSDSFAGGGASDETLEQQLLRGAYDLQAVCERRLDADVELLLRTTSCMHSAHPC